MASNWLSFEDTPAGLPTMAMGAIVAMLPFCIAMSLALIAGMIDRDGSGVLRQISHAAFWLAFILSILTIPTGAFLALSGLIIFIKSRKSLGEFSHKKTSQPAKQVCVLQAGQIRKK